MLLESFQGNAFVLKRAGSGAPVPIHMASIYFQPHSRCKKKSIALQYVKLSFLNPSNQPSKNCTPRCWFSHFFITAATLPRGSTLFAFFYWHTLLEEVGINRS